MATITVIKTETIGHKLISGTEWPIELTIKTDGEVYWVEQLCNGILTSNGDCDSLEEAYKDWNIALED